MADKNIVDDYYSKIAWDSKEEPSNEEQKLKIKPKRKIVVKKVQPKNNEAKVAVKKEISSTTSKKTANFSTPKTGLPQKKSKEFVQTMNVVKKPVNTTKKSTVKTVGTNNSTAVKKPAWAGYDKTAGKYGTAGRSFTMSAPKKSENLENKPRPQGSHAEKVWTDNAVAGGGKSNQAKKTSPTRKTFWNYKTRWRVKTIEDKDFSFWKWNKLAKRKKEEKNIEDIQQNLTDRTWSTVILQDISSLKEFSEKIGIALPRLMGEFMKNGMMMTINSQVDFDTAVLISEAFDVKESSRLSCQIPVTAKLNELEIELAPES